ncbi:MAG: hypothetical protein HZA46_11165 [Planctomycetales bacterium]|nr:hypothetical protein [Planctomycetales bacterium]
MAQRKAKKTKPKLRADHGTIDVINPGTGVCAMFHGDTQGTFNSVDVETTPDAANGWSIDRVLATGTGPGTSVSAPDPPDDSSNGEWYDLDPVSGTDNFHAPAQRVQTAYTGGSASPADGGRLWIIAKWSNVGLGTSEWGSIQPPKLYGGFTEDSSCTPQDRFSVSKSKKNVCRTVSHKLAFPEYIFNSLAVNQFQGGNLLMLREGIALDGAKEIHIAATRVNWRPQSALLPVILSPLGNNQNATSSWMFPTAKKYSLVVTQNWNTGWMIKKMNPNNPTVIKEADGLNPNRRIFVQVNDQRGAAHFADNKGSFDLWVKVFK